MPDHRVRLVRRFSTDAVIAQFRFDKRPPVFGAALIFMTWANRLAFVLVCATVVFTTLAYGTVHQPVIAVFYSVTAMLAVLWALDGVIGGSVRVSRSLLQIPLLAAAVYGLIQVIPIGSIGQIAGVPEFRGRSRLTRSPRRFRLCISLHCFCFSPSHCGFSIRLHDCGVSPT